MPAQFTFPPDFNVATCFIDRNVAEGRGENIAIETADERVAYHQLLERVNRCGNLLLGLDVRPEERVMLLLLDSPEFAYAFFGAIKAGAVPVPVNTLLKPHDYEYLLNDSRSRVLMVSESLLSQVQAIPRERLRYLHHVVVAGNAPEGTHVFSMLMAQASPRLEPEPSGPDAPAFWLYSSGSTGNPKGCVHLHHDMVVCAELYAKNVLQIRESDRCFSVAKLFFAYGLGNALYFPFSVGATTILYPGPPAAREVYRTIEKYRPTLFFSVPSNYAALLNCKMESGMEFDLSSIRHAVSAGEALPATIYEKFRRRFGVEILDAIGSTETLHMFIANRPGDVRPGSSGRVLDGCEAKLVNENEIPVAVGEIGNLLIKSDATCACYWNQHEKTKATIEGHWIRTGDKYYQDADGYYWYAGRSDDMLKVSGAWVSPLEIENTLSEHPAVQEAAVVGRADQDELVKPAAYVVLRPEFSSGVTLAQELQEFVTSRLAVFKRPRWVEFVPQLPRTATGKLQRYKLREITSKADSASHENS
jgi:benzoate-CoA ligase family protein